MGTEEKAELLSFEENERVLCYHGPLIYEAKILERKWMDEDPDFTGPYYFVHYKGWKRSWDEWVPETRVLRWSEANIQMQSRLKDMYRSKKTPKASAGVTSSLGKRRRDAKNEKEEDYLKRPELRLDIPDTLKGQLVDDWENVTRNQQLVTLPRTVNVNEVLARYKKFKQDKKGSRELNEELLDEVVRGLRTYFNKALGTMLLYRQERHQYADIRKQHPDKDLVELYGAEHLLRLFVQMPGLIAHTNMNDDSAHALTDYLQDLLRFMQKQQKQLFQTEYEAAPFDYVALSNSN